MAYWVDRLTNALNEIQLLEGPVGGERSDLTEAARIKISRLSPEYGLGSWLTHRLHTDVELFHATMCTLMTPNSDKPSLWRKLKYNRLAASSQVTIIDCATAPIGVGAVRALRRLYEEEASKDWSLIDISAEGSLMVGLKEGFMQHTYVGLLTQCGRKGTYGKKALVSCGKTIAVKWFVRSRRRAGIELRQIKTTEDLIRHYTSALERMSEQTGWKIIYVDSRTNPGIRYKAASPLSLLPMGKPALDCGTKDLDLAVFNAWRKRKRGETATGENEAEDCRCKTEPPINLAGTKEEEPTEEEASYAWTAFVKDLVAWLALLSSPSTNSTNTPSGEDPESAMKGYPYIGSVLWWKKQRMRCLMF